MEKSIYSSGEYITKNHSYHTEDSFFKWSNFKNILKKSNFNFEKIKSILEIGCGAGQIISNAKKSGLFNNSSYVGYDINPDAIKLAKELDNSIKFINEDFLKKDDYSSCDLILAADVFEHIENSYHFLKKLREKGNFFLFNIPLEISCFSLIRKKNIFKNSYDGVGHLHFYNKETALITLNHCGYEVINFKYAKNRFHEIKNKKDILRFFAFFPQYFLDKFSEDFASSIFGGYSLVVLAKKN
tara:strand:+ start:3509 stop:4234 length:726 start_codon:yes stop_codon:yes gene_type:complete